MRLILFLSVSLLLCACTSTRQLPGNSRLNEIQIGDASITHSLTGDPPPVTREQIHNWVASAARRVSDYYGHFPVNQVQVDLRVAGSGRIGGGVTYSGRRIEIQIGSRTQVRDLERDWRMTHEMFHLGFPMVDEKYEWMGEGLSTYLEPLARARDGNMTAQQVWIQFVRQMPQGLPREGDQGLDQTHTWGRTYWGGAIFWLLADVKIRDQTQNQRSLDDAIRAIVDAGGDGSARWPIERILQTADRATGTTVLSQLYKKYAMTGESPDLEALWRQLGIEKNSGPIRFNGDAPLAALRRSMTQPRPSTTAMKSSKKSA